MNRWRDWLEQGVRDLRHAEHSLNDADYEWAAFASQQAAEKMVKALIMVRGGEPWGHLVTGLVEALPKDAAEHEEDGEKVYQYGDAYFVKETEDKGKSGFTVTAPPASEVFEADKLPADAVMMDVDAKTYYYVDGAFYLPDTESGKKVYAVAEPPEGGNVKTVPDGAVVFTIEATKYYQFDNIFFKDKAGGGYVIVAEPSSS